ARLAAWQIPAQLTVDARRVAGVHCQRPLRAVVTGATVLPLVAEVDRVISDGDPTPEHHGILGEARQGRAARSPRVHVQPWSAPAIAEPTKRELEERTRVRILDFRRDR